jgi:hypothetical protein
MYKEFSTNMKDEDMFLSTEDTYSSDVDQRILSQLNPVIGDLEAIVVLQISMLSTPQNPVCDAP